MLSSQRGPSGKKDEDNPLSNGGFTWVPNVAHVFRTDQHMYLLYEVYDPASAPPKVTPASAPAAKPHGTPGQAGVKVLTSIELLQGTTKVFETPWWRLPA